MDERSVSRLSANNIIIFIIFIIITIITIGISWFFYYQSDINIRRINKEICDVTGNKRFYNAFETRKTRCPVTYEEKLDFDYSLVEDKNLLGYIKVITRTWIDGEAFAIALEKKFMKEDQGLYQIEFVNSETDTKEFAYIHHHHKGTDYHISVFSGIFRRLSDSADCEPTNDVITWNDNTLERARLYIFYRELNARKMLETALGSTCPALKYRPDL